MDESQCANCTCLVLRGRMRHSCDPELDSVNTYPVLESPWIFHDLDPQWVHLASLASITNAASLMFLDGSDDDNLSQLFLERQMPSGSTTASVSSTGRLCI